jgi:multiple sugar transport system permease protein
MSNTVSTAEKIKKINIHLILAAGAFFMIIPFVWMLVTSLKEPGTEFVFPPQWIPQRLDFSNYPKALDLVPLVQLTFNSVRVASIVTLGQLITASMAAYAFARLKFPGRDQIFMAYLATMMVPQQVTLIPQFIIMKFLGLLDTTYSLILPNLVAAFGTFLLRQFFMTLPKELEEAATIDGCNPIRIFLNIILPLTKPALSALAIFVFMGSWNNLLQPLIFVSSMAVRTLPLGLAYFVDFYEIKYTLLMAAATMALLPVIIVYLSAQKYFVEGITLSGIKG